MNSEHSSILNIIFNIIDIRHKWWENRQTLVILCNELLLHIDLFGNCGQLMVHCAMWIVDTSNEKKQQSSLRIVRNASIWAFNIIHCFHKQITNNSSAAAFAQHVVLKIKSDVCSFFSMPSKRILCAVYWDYFLFIWTLDNGHFWERSFEFVKRTIKRTSCHHKFYF